MCTLWASGAGKYVSFYKTPTLLTNKLLLPPCIWNHPRQKHYSNLFAYQIGFENIDYEWVVFAKLPKTSDQLHTNEHLSRFDGQLILPYMTPAQLEMEDGDVVDVFQARSSLFLAKLVVGDLVMVFLFILWKAVIDGGIVFTAAGEKGKNILNKQLNILQA